jgi:acyl-CoA synthetase (AMP-forming)/AMP-acid ligase II
LSDTELDALVRRFAAGIAERTLGPGDVLAILAPNSPVWPVAAMCGQLAGGLRLVEEHRGTVLPATPLVVRDLARHPAVDRCDLSSPEFVAWGAGTLPARPQSACAARLNRR